MTSQNALAINKRRRPPHVLGARQIHRSLGVERLEERHMLAATPVGDLILVNDFTTGEQSAIDSSMPVVLSAVNSVVVFEGKGPVDRHGVFAEVLDSDGQTSTPSFRVNSTIHGDQRTPTVAGDDDGNFVVAWAGRGVGDKSGIFFRRFDATGTPIGEETLVNTTTGGAQTAPAIAMAEDRSFAIAWSGVGDMDASGVFLRRFDASGVAMGEQQQINTTTRDHQIDPTIAFDSAGNLVAAWSSRHQDGSDWGLFGRRFDTSGGLDDEFRWNSTTDDSQQGVTLAAERNGGIVAAWQSREQDGDGWGVVARRLDADGTTLGDEIVLNNTSAGHQRDVRLAIAEDGQWLTAWTTNTTDSDGWEVVARSFLDNGTPDGDAFTVSGESAGGATGQRQHASVAIAGERASIVWSGNGSADHQGVYLQSYEVELVDDGPQQSPEIATIGDRMAEVGSPMEVRITATDPNVRDDLTFTLDAAISPATAALEQLDNNTAIVSWTPAESDEGKNLLFRVQVTDDGEPPLRDMEDFQVTVGVVPIAIDLNGSSEPGSDSMSTFVTGRGPAVIVDDALAIVGADDGMVTSATARLDTAPDGGAEQLSVDLLDTVISADYDATTRTITLSGTDTAANYARVLRTLSYNNTAAEPGGMRTVGVQVSDTSGASNVASSEITIEAIDLVGFAQALSDSGTQFFGAAWCPHCTAQKELFEDGSQLLPFIEVTNPDRSPNQVGIDNNITDYPTWVFPDDSRLEGMQSLQTLSMRSGVAIPTSAQPFLAPLPDDTLLVGSPLHVPLDGYDPNGGPLAYSVTTDNPAVTGEILSGNRSARISVNGFGNMTAELFEGRAKRATDRVIELADDNFYKDIIFHRVLDGFVIQGGDPTGTGTGGSTLGDFDDQFHVDLQHNRTGLLSYAKSSIDDTNDSQFFITEGDSASLRNLDFNHTIFGILTEGEAVREAISNTAVSGPADSPRPINDVVMEGIEIFQDDENATLMLKAADGTTGPVNVTVTVTDQQGNSFDRTFVVNVSNDTQNGRPFLGDIGPVSVASNSSAEIQLTATDVEGDPVVFSAVRRGTAAYTFDVSDGGLLTVTPPTDFVGPLEIEARVRREFPTNSTDLDSQLITINVG